LVYIKIIILSVVLYERETRSLTLREEHRLKVFEQGAEENTGAKRDEVTGGWRKVHNEEIICILCQV
jgi:hypothetical protein